LAISANNSPVPYIGPVADPEVSASNAEGSRTGRGAAGAEGEKAQEKE